jgi:hypothetical protein
VKLVDKPVTCIKMMLRKVRPLQEENGRHKAFYSKSQFLNKTRFSDGNMER